jgi:hypothetical protein
LRFNSDKLGNIARDTLRLFKWDEQSKLFELISCSGVISKQDFVWGKIHRPGLYAIIGLNSNPLFVRTIQVLTTLASFIGAFDYNIQKQLIEKVHSLMLGSEEISKQLENPNVLEALIRSSAQDGLPDPFNLSSLPSPDVGSKIDKDISLFDVGRIARLPEAALVVYLPRERPLHSVFPVDYGWQSIGPANLSGCIYQIALDPNNRDVVYAAAADGGLWRREGILHGQWIPLMDESANLQIDVFAVAPSRSETIYVADRLGYISRSDDRGRNWFRTGNSRLGFLNGTGRAIQKLIVDPTNHETIYVASNQGFWKSETGGRSGGWVNLRAGDITDAAIDFTNSFMYIGRRGVGIEKSDISGRVWTTFCPFRSMEPRDGMIKLSLGTLDSKGDGIMAVKFHREVSIIEVCNGSAGSIFDKGQRGQDPSWPDQANYDNVIAVHPSDNNIIFAGLQDLYLTTRGLSATPTDWSKVAGDGTSVHMDQHAIVFDPNQSNVVYLCNDGGVFRSEDTGNTWDDLNRGLITTQFYTLGISGNRAVGNVYHWGDLADPDLSINTDWEVIEGGGMEFPYVSGDPIQPNTFYFLVADGIRRRPYPYPTTPPGDLNHPTARFGPFPPTPGALTPFAISPNPSSSTIIAGRINPVGIMVNRNARANIYNPTDGLYYPDTTQWHAETVNDIGAAPIMSISFAPSNHNMVYAISKVGEVYRKNNITSSEPWVRTGIWNDGWNDSQFVRQFAINPRDENRIYAISHNKVACSTNGGREWHEILGDEPKHRLPPDSVFNSIIAYPFDGQTLFVATDTGVYVTVDEGRSWRTFHDTLPNVAVYQLLWSGPCLFAVTHGRGIWLRELAILLRFHEQIE